MPSTGIAVRRRRSSSATASWRSASPTRSRPASRSARTTWSSRTPRHKLVEETAQLAKDYEQQYNDGLITQGEKYNKVVDAWAKCTDQVAEEMMKRIQAVEKDDERPPEADELDLHDEPLGRARLAGADEAARRHARPDGQAVGRDHREPDHLELQGRPVGARVLQLDPRRPQGPRRHGAEDGQLRLSDAPSRRRGAGLHRHRAGLRHRRRPEDAGDRRFRPGGGHARPCASSAAPRPRTSSRRRPARSSSRPAR